MFQQSPTARACKISWPIGLASKNLSDLRMPPRSSWELRDSGSGKIAATRWIITLGYYAASSGNFTTTRRAQFLATSHKFLLARWHKYHAYILGVYDPISKFNENSCYTYYAHGRKIFPAKKLNIYFQKVGSLPLFFFFSLSLSLYPPFFLSPLTFLPTGCYCYYYGSSSFPAVFPDFPSEL